MGQQGRRRRVAGSVTLLAAVVLLAAGCGDGPVSGQAAGGSDRTQEQTGEATPTSPAEPKAPPQTTTTTPRPKPTRETTQPPLRLCKSADLKLSLGRGDAGAGTVMRPLRFTNISGSRCEIQGFPGVSYVAGDDGHQVGAAAYRVGTKGKPVVLPAGHTAHAPVAFANVDNYDPDECRPTKVRGLRVYPPQETSAMYLPAPGRGCANENIDDYHLKVKTIAPGPGPR